MSQLCGGSRGNSPRWEPRRLSRPASISSKNRPKPHSSRARSHGSFTDLGFCLCLLSSLSPGEKERLEASEASLEKKKNWSAELCQGKHSPVCLDCSTHTNLLHLELNSRQITHLRTIKWVDWMCIKVVKSSLSICNKKQFKVNSSSSHTHGFTSGDYHDLYFNLPFNLFLVTDPCRMLVAPYFGRNWSVCMESRTGKILFKIDQHNVYGFFWQPAWLIAAFTDKRPSHRDHLTGQKNKCGVQFFPRRSKFSPAFY